MAIDDDLADPTTISGLFHGADSALSRVDNLVNNATHCELADDILTISAGSIDRHFAVNVRVAVLLTAGSVASHRERNCTSGLITNICADCAQYFGKPISYGGNKVAMKPYTRRVAFGLLHMASRSTLSTGVVHTGELDYRPSGQGGRWSQDWQDVDIE